MWSINSIMAVETMFSLLTRLEEKGYDGVVFDANDPQRGRLCKLSMRRSGQRHPSFDELRDITLYAASDVYFRVGSIMLKRRRGWPMGGPLSEPATLVQPHSLVLLLLSRLSRSPLIPRTVPAVVMRFISIRFSTQPRLEAASTLLSVPTLVRTT